MTIKDILKLGIEKFKESNIETPVVEAGVIICHVLGCDRGFIYVHEDFELDEDMEITIRTLFDQRSLGVPVQYIIGKQEFMSLEFCVSKDVLIPRADTEILVESVLKYLKGINCVKNGVVDILDIGTGSGCIAVSLAYYFKNSNVTAVDISEGALAVARTNALNNNVCDRVSFKKSNVYSGFLNERFDVIVSNPPYIPTSDIATLMREVKDHEPFNALNGGADGLSFYRKIIEEAPRFLNSGGFIAFEVGICQAVSVKEIMEISFTNIQIYKDLAGIERVVLGVLK